MRIKLLDKNCKPIRTHETDSGLDLKARLSQRISVSQHTTVKIPTGIIIELPKGYEGQVRPRSSVFEKGIYINGTIDNGYRGEIIMIVVNTTDTPYIINPYDRIAQLVVCPVLTPELEFVDELSTTERSDNGFGSTGVN